MIEDMESQLMDPNDAADEVPCWIVWERASDGGRPYLRAIDTTEGMANRHAAYLRNCARIELQPIPDILVEESRINHLYAANLIAAIIKRGQDERARNRK